MPSLKEKKYSRDLKHDFKKIKERNISKKTQKIDLIMYSITLLFSLYIAFVLFFSDRNLKNLIAKEKELKNLKAKEAELLKLEAKLKEDIKNIKEDRFYVEKLARENLGLMKKDEVIFIIPEEYTEEEKKNRENEEKWIYRVIQKIGIKNWKS